MNRDPVLAAMYQDALLAEYRAPQNRRRLPRATGSGSRRNPLCGDEIAVEVRVVDAAIEDVAFTGRGCAIATASASLLTGVVRSLAPAEALRLAEDIDAMLRGAEVAVPAPLEPLRSVVPFPARHSCVAMPWQALRDALREALSGAPSQAPGDATP